MSVKLPFPENLHISDKAPSHQNIEIYFEAYGNPENPAILLIMGLDGQCTLWSANFIDPLVRAGYYVIRFDNRDIGLSTWVEDWDRRKPYTLEDMAKDAVSVLDHLKISKSHIVGASMGGMIAQRVAISHQERVLSLTSIMSSGYALNFWAQPDMAGKIRSLLVPFVIRNFDIKSNFTHFKVTVGNYLSIWRELAGSGYPFDEAYYKALFHHNIVEREGQNPKARIQQLSAIIASGSRLHQLYRVKVPSLVVHGTDDTLVPIEHAKIYAPKLPNARTLWLEGVGHEIPHPVIPQIHQAMYVMFEQSEEKKIS